MLGKKFQNVAKEGLQFSDEGEKEKEVMEEYEETYKPLTTWLKEKALSDLVSICFLKPLPRTQYGHLRMNCWRSVMF